MAILKCKMCGGDLDIGAETTVVECEYCGTKQTVPNVDDEKKITLFSRANRLRFACEFDKAAGIYESIIADFPEEAEAYWGLVLCKYGIEYVDDPATAKKIPTCHRSSFDSVMDDSNFDLVLENADVVARSVYREEAKQIEELRKGIIEVSSKEEPYDIFICYKETAENGDRTVDSVIAQDVYTELVDKGYRVFFSRITLEDKLGQEYEPYIFAALNSAKIMLAFGTDYEYYNAVWVKNEWSRFLQLIAKGEKKTLIPCYKDIDAYDMPKEFARLQAQDMGKVGAIQDLLRGIEKILPREIAKTETVVTSAANANAVSLLQRAFIFLEDEDWNSADEYCEKVLDISPQCAEAYLGKLMAELNVSKKEDLKNTNTPFDDNANYQKAIRFADDMLKRELVAIIQHIEYSENKKIYNEAKDILNGKNVTIDDVNLAIKKLEKIIMFEDTEQVLKEANCMIQSIKETQIENLYNRAVNMLDKGLLFSAIRVFEKLGNYKDSKTFLDIAKSKLEPTIQLAPVSKCYDKYGYINEAGDMIIKPQFDNARCFAENGLAAVNSNGLWGFIDETGDMIIAPQFDDAYNFSKNNFAAVKINDKWGYINELGDIVIKPQFDDASAFSENGLMAVELNGKWGFINENGKMVIDPVFDYAFHYFAKNGLMAVESNGQWGFVNKTGDTVIKPQFDYAYDFSDNGLAPVEINGKWGYINELGDMVIEPQFDDAEQFYESGLAVVELNDKWGYINELGDVVIEPRFDAANGFYESNLAAVKINDKWGYVNENGDMVIEPKFDDAEEFYENGLAKVQLNNLWGFVDKNGDVVITPQYKEAYIFAENGLAMVTPYELWGFIDEMGNSIVEPRFEVANFSVLSQNTINERNKRRKVLKQKAEERRLAEERRFAEEKRLAEEKHKRIMSGLCQHCGGTFKGLFTKKCSSCGKVKDY